jgi:hypothetical protein
MAASINARLAVTPGGGLTASTFAAPSFEFVNTGPIAVTALTIDLAGSLVAGGAADFIHLDDDWQLRQVWRRGLPLL